MGGSWLGGWSTTVDGPGQASRTTFPDPPEATFPAKPLALAPAGLATVRGGRGSTRARVFPQISSGSKLTKKQCRCPPPNGVVRCSPLTCWHSCFGARNKQPRLLLHAAAWGVGGEGCTPRGARDQNDRAVPSSKAAAPPSRGERPPRPWLAAAAPHPPGAAGRGANGEGEVRSSSCGERGVGRARPAGSTSRACCLVQQPQDSLPCPPGGQTPTPPFGAFLCDLRRDS